MPSAHGMLPAAHYLLTMACFQLSVQEVGCCHFRSCALGGKLQRAAAGSHAGSGCVRVRLGLDLRVKAVMHYLYHCLNHEQRRNTCVGGCHFGLAIVKCGKYGVQICLYHYVNHLMYWNTVFQC